MNKSFFVTPILSAEKYYPLLPRRFPEVYDLCHTFLHVMQVKKTRTCDNRTLNAFFLLAQVSRTILARPCVF